MSLTTGRKKILFLYSELAAYVLACIKRLSTEKEVEVYIIHWPVNQEAPFKLQFPDNVKAWEKGANMPSLQKIVKEISPDLIYCSGWIDKDYLEICKKYKKTIPVVLGMDNKWKGSLKQYVSILASPFTIKKYYTHCWVPGDPQYVYALKLGFKKDHIYTGFYSADVDLFNQYYQNTIEDKKHRRTRRFIYVGRYYEFKGILDLWKAFSELSDEIETNWELWCLGTGDISPVKHPEIKHVGFVQPEDMAGYIKDTDVFILPSHVEPWGVVVHEFAAAGFPLICSDKVGAASAFIEDGVNGFVFPSGDVEALKQAMKKMAAKHYDELIEMGQKSIQKAKQVTPQKWVDTLMKILNKQPE